MYGEKLPPGVIRIRKALLTRMHTWFPIDGIMWHIAARYHPAGISSGRCIMSCVLDSWSLISPTVQTCVGPGMVITQEWWGPDELIAELQTRPRIYVHNHSLFPQRELRILSIEELTILTLEVMRRGTVNIIRHHGWDGIKNTLHWIRSLENYFGKKPMPDKFRFLPMRMFGRELPELNSHIKALIDELESRRDRVVMCPFEGIIPAAPQEKQTLFE